MCQFNDNKLWKRWFVSPNLSFHADLEDVIKKIVQVWEVLPINATWEINKYLIVSYIILNEDM